MNSYSVIMITSGQRILTKGRIAEGEVWHRPVGSIAIRCSSGAV